jgi:hypothetical protein
MGPKRCFGPIFLSTALTLFDQARLRFRDQIGGAALKEVAVQVSAASPAVRYAPPQAAASGQASTAIADLTQLAVAQTNIKMAADAGAALGQTTGELTGVLVDISA